MDALKEVLICRTIWFMNAAGDSPWCDNSVTHLLHICLTADRVINPRISLHIILEIKMNCIGWKLQKSWKI